ncbi:MAG: hypothetical protein R3Y09_00560 [Clostridia bacterium]
MKKSIKYIAIEFIVFIALMTILCVINYIDLSVVMTIYLPIFIISALLIIFKKYYIGHIFLISAELGLIAEYIFHLISADNPNLSGAFLNMIILAIGLIVGIIAQIYKSKNK